MKQDDKQKQKRQWRRLGLQAQLVLLEIMGIITNIQFAGMGFREYRRTFHKEQWQERHRLINLLWRLERDGLIERSGRGRSQRITLTKDGQRRIKQILAERLEAPRDQPWNKKWHAIIFDIPEDHRLGRDLLRRKLKELGCYQLQLSVFIYPYDIQTIIEQIRDAYDLRTDICYLIVESTDRTTQLVHYFRERGILPKSISAG